MNNLASEFFYIGIARIPAGVVIIALFWSKQAANIFDAHTRLFSSPSLFIACILVIAFVVGFVVDAITFVLIEFVLRKLAPHCKLLSWLLLHLLGERTPEKPLTLKEQVVALESKIASLQEENEKLKLEVKSFQDNTQKTNSEKMDNNLERERRRQFYFGAAELIMSRCLFVTFVFAWLLHLACSQLPDTILDLNGYYYFGCSCAFLVAWFLLKLKQQKQLKKSSSSREIDA